MPDLFETLFLPPSSGKRLDAEEAIALLPPQRRAALANEALTLALALGADEVASSLVPFSNPEAPRADLQDRNGPMLACEQGCPQALAAMLSRCDPSATDRLGRTALILAAGLRSPECLRILLPSSPLLATDLDGDCALVHATACGRGETVRILLDAIMESRLPDSEFASILHRATSAARRAGFRDIEHDLLEIGSILPARAHIAGAARPAPSHPATRRL
jgi:hypothetical protein